MSCSAPGNGARVRPGFLSGRAVAGRSAFSPTTSGLSLATPTAPISTKHILQPFIAYTTPQAWTFTLQGEDTYDWKTGEWLAPINFLVSKIVKIEGQPVSIVGGVRYWIDSPDTGPHGFGGRLGMTFLFPTR